jgi:hypothetical protein
MKEKRMKEKNYHPYDQGFFGFASSCFGRIYIFLKNKTKNKKSKEKETKEE